MRHALEMVLPELQVPGTADPIVSYSAGSQMLVSAQGQRFPVVDDVPILYESTDGSDCASPTARDEARFYDNPDSDYLVTSMADIREAISSCRGVPPEAIRAAPGWLDSTYEFSAQAAAYEHLEPLAGSTVLQLGGTGLHAVKFLLAGAAVAVTLTPFLEEAREANRLADECGVGDRHSSIVAIGEQLPFRDSSFDRVYSGGSVHHLDCALAFAEVRRILVKGGRFASVDPWKTPIYGLGTKLFGKRERDVSCRPLDTSRTGHAVAAFESCAVQRFHPVLRYPLILAARLPVRLSNEQVKRLLAFETRIERRLPRALRDRGSCVSITATR